MGYRKGTAVGVEETWAGEEKGSREGDMQAWMVYVHEHDKKSGRDALSLCRKNPN